MHKALILKGNFLIVNMKVMEVERFIERVFRLRDKLEAAAHQVKI